MLTGPIRLRADLRGEEKQIDNGYQIRYRFDRVQRPPEKWAQCRYGAGPAIRLIKRVRDDTMECILTVQQAPAAPKITFVCR